MNHFPRAILHRQRITVELTPAEIYVLIRGLEERATLAANAGLDDAADAMFLRVAQLREACR